MTQKVEQLRSSAEFSPCLPTPHPFSVMSLMYEHDCKKSHQPVQANSPKQEHTKFSVESLLQRSSSRDEAKPGDDETKRDVTDEKKPISETISWLNPQHYNPGTSKMIVYINM